MADESEARNKQVSVAMTVSEVDALRFLESIHPGRFQGYTDVLREYSLNDAVAVHRRAKALTASPSAA